jgi:hypothetical protein
MKSDGRTISKWLLVVLTVVASTLVMATFLELSPLIVIPAFALASSRHLNVAPSLILHLVNRLILIGTALLWVLPMVFAIGFAVRAKWLFCLQWGFFISFVLLAFLFCVLSPSDQGTLWAVVVAVCLLLAERLASARNMIKRVAAIAVQWAALFVLFTPLISQLVFAQSPPPEPRIVWSIILQEGTWQAMNTGSEFAATRQVVFAGDRIVVLFDSGHAPYKGTQPMSRYKVISLDRGTGAVKKQMELIGRWGALPYLLPTSNGDVILANSQLQVLNPDLKTIRASFPIEHGRVDIISPDGTTLAWEKDGGTTLLNASDFKPIVTLSKSAPTSISSEAMLTDNISWPKKYPEDHAFITRTDEHGSRLIFHGECGDRPQFLTSNRILSAGCGWLRIMNNDGATVATRRDSEDAYTFAGVNQRGTRFALQASDETGDPSSLIDERFYIYDVNSAVPFASISVSDLPERQSWTAFSPDGRFFAVGNPNRLSLYELPRTVAAVSFSSDVGEVAILDK